MTDKVKPEVALMRAKKDILREFVNEQLGFIKLQCDIAQMNIEGRDDTGLIYSVKRLVAHAKAMAMTARELQELDMRERIVAGGHEPDRVEEKTPEHAE